MNYNHGYKYNFSLDKGGLGYNSIKFRIIVRLYDVINISDDMKLASAIITLFDRPRFTDFLTQTILHSLDERFSLDTTDMKVFALFEVAERLNIVDELSEIIVLLSLNENLDVLDQIRELNNYLETDDEFSLEDAGGVDALISLAEKYGLSEVRELFALIEEYENPSIVDRDRTAISDFIIGKVDYLDGAFDWILPFGMMYDKRNSTIQVMPQAESNYIELPAIDGSTPEYTVYKNRIFSIIAYSPDGLTVEEKEELKRDIARILDSTKHQTKKLTFQSSGTSFDVKYTGAVDVAEGPSFVRMITQFEASPYGYPLFDNEVYGSGLLVNNGAADAGPVNSISGGAVNPSFRMGAITYSWKGTVPKGSTLVIDHEAYMCYLETNAGVRTNAVQYLTGDFQQIPKESSVAITALGNTESYLHTKLKEKILW